MICGNRSKNGSSLRNRCRSLYPFALVVAETPLASGPIPLRLLHVTPYFYPAWAYGGIPRLSYGLCRTLVERGHQVTVLTTDVRDEGSRLPGGEHDVDGIRVLRLRNLSNSLAYHHQAFLPPGILPTLAHLPEVDVVHIHGHRHIPGAAAGLWAEKRGIPVILHPNGTLPRLERKQGAKRIFDHLLGDHLVQSARAFVAVSRAEIAQMRQYGVPADKIALIPNGLDLAEFEQMPTPGSFKATHGLSGQRIVLYLGKLTPRKGVDHLLTAFAHLPHPDVHLVIAGNDMGGLLPELRRQARQLGVESRVHFSGLVEGALRLALLADAEVLAYPSTAEIFGLVPFEGLLAGAPVVVGDDCGCGELVQAAGAGLLVRYGDVEGLARALSRLLDNEGERLSRVQRGRSYIEKHFTWEVVTNRMEQVYQKVRLEKR